MKFRTIPDYCEYKEYLNKTKEELIRIIEITHLILKAFQETETKPALKIETIIKFCQKENPSLTDYDIRCVAHNMPIIEAVTKQPEGKHLILMDSDFLGYGLRLRAFNFPDSGELY